MYVHTHSVLREREKERKTERKKDRKKERRLWADKALSKEASLVLI